MALNVKLKFKGNRCLHQIYQPCHVNIFNSTWHWNINYGSMWRWITNLCYIFSPTFFSTNTPSWSIKEAFFKTCISKTIYSHKLEELNVNSCIQVCKSRHAQDYVSTYKGSLNDFASSLNKTLLQVSCIRKLGLYLSQVYI